MFNKIIHNKKILLLSVLILFAIVGIVTKISGASIKQIASDFDTFSNDVYSVDYPKSFNVVKNSVEDSVVITPKDGANSQRIEVKKYYSSTGGGADLDSIESDATTDLNGNEVAMSEKSSIHGKTALIITPNDYLAGFSKQAYVQSGSDTWLITVSSSSQESEVATASRQIIDSFKLESAK